MTHLKIHLYPGKLFNQILLLFLFFSGGICVGQQEFPLYPGTIPNSKEVPDEEQKSANEEVDSIVTKVSHPTLSAYLPSRGKANGSAVIICPGGGYHALLTKREGSDIARVFNQLGVTAFVLKYRLPSDVTMEDKSIGPLQDAQQAIKVIRERRKEWNIDPEKIGIMGFSAGGHLAAMAGTKFDSPMIDNPDGTSLRPDYMILIYPVISFTDSIGHIGSRNFLLGTSPTKEQVRLFSNEFQVKKETPPAFITHGGDDSVVPVANSMEFYQVLQKKGIPSELHLYAHGEHGYLGSPSFEEWFGRCEHWMREMGLI